MENTQSAGLWTIIKLQQHRDSPLSNCSDTVTN